MTGLLQGIAHILSGDLDSADVVLNEAVRTGQEIGTPDTIAQILCERSLVAMARNQWNRAEARQAKRARCWIRPGWRTLPSARRRPA